MTLNREELIHPIFYLLFITAPIFGIWFDFLTVLSERTLLFFIVLNLFHLTHSVKLKGDEIISGTHIFPFGFIKIKKRIKLNDIKELIVYQNEKKYREIRAITSNDFLIIKTIANRIPAEKELEVIKSKIKSQKEIIQNFN